MVACFVSHHFGAGEGILFGTNLTLYKIYSTKHIFYLEAIHF